MKNLNDVISSVDEVLNNAKLSNFEDVFSRTKSYAEKAQKKSAETLEASRKMVEFLDCKTKLAKAYEKFGKLQYSAVEGVEVSEDDVNASIEEIRMLKDRIEYISSEIEIIKAEAAAAFKSDTKWEAKRAAREAKRAAKSKDNDIPTEGKEVVKDNPEE